MNKDIFVKELEEELRKGGIDRNEIADTCAYYRNYFIEKISAGYSEQQVLNELGDPRLIAKTIIDTSSSNRNASRVDYDNTSDTDDHKNDFIKIIKVKNKLKVALIVLAVVALITLFFVFAIKIFIFFLPVILIFGLLRLIFR